MTNLLFGEVDQPASIVPVPNIGAPFDIPTGTPVVGFKMETIINGGIHHVNGIVGEGNVGKTAVAIYMFVTVIYNYAISQGLIYDSEGNLKKQRLRITADALYQELIYTLEEIEQSEGRLDEYDLRRIVFTTVEKYMGDELWSMVKSVVGKSAKNKKDVETIDTPFKDRKGQPLKIAPFVQLLIDSISMFQVSSHDDIKSNAVGSNKRNMESMRDSGAKSQLINELPAFCLRNNLFVTMTAHIGAQHQIDPMTPPKKVLAYLSQKQKIKNVPEKFLFVPQTVWYIYGTNTLFNSSQDRTPLYPRSSTDEKIMRDTDLQIANLMCLRNKSGLSGSPFEIIISQSEGILPTLSQFHYCKTRDRFGLAGNLINIKMVLYPSCTFTRNTIREKIREDNKLVNAIRLTTEILQSRIYHPTYVAVSATADVTMEQIYEKLTADGYNWDELLETRGYWLPDQYTNHVRYLSGIDLLNMYLGVYKPYWM